MATPTRWWAATSWGPTRPRSCRWRPSPSRWAPPRPISMPRRRYTPASPRNSSPCARRCPRRIRRRPRARYRRRRATMRRLEGRIALVTGAASGIGRATARLLAEEGAHVYLADVNGEGVEEAVGEIAAAGLAVQAVTADVSLGQDVTAMFRAVEKGHGRLDVLVNNAGLNVRGDFRHLSDADWARIREVNL